MTKIFNNITVKTLFSVIGIYSVVMISNITESRASDLPEDYSLKDNSAINHSSNWYISLFGGINIVDDVDFSNGQRTVATDFDEGIRLGAAVGRKWNNYQFRGLVPRTELEVSYSENDVDTLDFSGNGAGNEIVLNDSKISSFNVLASLYLDAPGALGNGLTPYFGGGIGFSYINHDIVYGANSLNLEDDDTVFTWHITGGVNYEINEKMSAFLDVGYHQAIDAGSERRLGIASIPGANGSNFEDDIETIVIRSGIKFNF